MESESASACWEQNAEAWTRLSRAGHDVYRDALNTPRFLGLLPPIRGLQGLDLGCGEGSNTRLLAQRGARMRALDVAPTFIRHARAAEAAAPLGIDYVVGDATALPYPDADFDFLTAFMVLMDVPDLAAVLREAHRVLRPGGFFQFSILHPCFVPPYRRVLRDADRRPRAVELAGYFDELNGQVDTFLFGTTPPAERAATRPFRVPRFHRTLSTVLNAVLAAGFTLRQLGEPSATAAEARAYPEVDDTRVVGIFLHVLVGR